MSSISHNNNKKIILTGKIRYGCKEDTYARVALAVQLLVALMDVLAQKMLGDVSRQYVEQ
jgi:isoprenylcysteine carboxyl methyltransferase (ICMT) family protein YpbQ